MQWYGEVPPEFVESSCCGTKKMWYLWDENGFQRVLSFSKDYIVPILTKSSYRPYFRRLNTQQKSP
jgi:hypothetical protein